MLKYNLKDVKNIGNIIKMYIGDRMVYHAYKIFSGAADDEINVSFNTSLTCTINTDINIEATTSPLLTSLSANGVTTLRDLYFYPYNNITRINHLPTEMPEPIFKKILAYMNNVEYIYLGNINVKHYYDISFALTKNPKLREVIMPDFTTSNVVKIQKLFAEDTALETVDFSRFDGNYIEDMSGLFQNCSSLKNVNMSEFVGNNVSLNASSVFSSCDALKEISLPKFEGSHTTDVSGFFQDCLSLEKVYMPKSNFSENGTIGIVFYNTPNLKDVTINGGKWFNYSVFNERKQYEHLRKLTVFNFGKAFIYTQRFEHLPNWGVDGDGMTDCKKSLIDTLITYSVPVDNITIRLSDNTKAVLTPDEIAAITAKGYTIA